MLASTALADAGAMAAQGELSGATPVPLDDGEPPRKVTLEGFVLAPDGSPAEGAVVVSSAGGKAVADSAGNYRFEVEVPSDATGVQVTAAGGAGRSLTASATVTLSSTTGWTPVDPLELVLGTSCSPSWLPTFGERPGTSDTVQALAVFDDGDGPALYVGGSFSTAGSAPASRIAKWDGKRWEALGSGMNDQVDALAVYDDGGGPALYAGGRFSMAGGVAASFIARWDGSSWASVGGGLSGGGVRALTVHDDGSGPALYAGGLFTMAGGVAASRIARWDGSSWAALGSGMNGNVSALATHDDGSGPALYAGGAFTIAGGVVAYYIARWDGASWSALGSGMSDVVQALAVYDDGGGPDLYAGGAFTGAGGVLARRIARWNGTSWSALGSGMNDTVRAMAVYDDGAGPALYAGGEFTTAGGVTARYIARWNFNGSSSWSDLGSGEGAGYDVEALTVYDDGGGSALFAGGWFLWVGGKDVEYIAAWDGSNWEALGNGLNGTVKALVVHDDGGGPALYAGGGFTMVGGVLVNGIAKWDGASWSALGSGVSGGVNALAIYDGGAGPALYAGGFGIARWNGSQWKPLGSGVSGGGVSALIVHDDGGGPALYAGGAFTSAGGVVANGIARWDGQSWSPLGSGMSGIYPFGPHVHALAVYDDGSGPALFAGGAFSAAGGVATNRIAKWDGSAWSALGSGMNADVLALAVHDDGSGPALCAGGDFTSAGGATAIRIAKWDGSNWSTLGTGMNGTVRCLAAYDDGLGPALYAGGGFSLAGGVAANNIAKWNGSSWSPLGGGLNDDYGQSAYSLAAFDDGGGPGLYAGGDFSRAFDSGDSYLALWGCDTVPPVPSCPPSITALDGFSDGLGEIVTFTVTATDDHDPSPAVACAPPSGSFFPRGTTVVTCTATDSSGNQSTCEFPVTVGPKARRR